MKTIKILVIILVVAIVGALVWAAFLPSDVKIEEKTVIKAPISKVFNQVNNFHNWQNWAPWQDSVYHTKYEGSQMGVGARMLWTDKKEGRSVQTITKSILNKEIVTELQFNKDSKPAKAYFYFTKLPSGTEVRWVMKLDDLSYPLGRFVGYMIEKGASYNFAKGLKKMKQYVETNKNKPDYDGYSIHKDKINIRFFLSSIDSAQMNFMKDKIGKDFAKILNTLTLAKIKPQGYPMVQWIRYSPKGISKYRCLIQTKKKQQSSGDIKTYTIPEGNFVWVKYIGPYSKSAIAWENINKYIKNNNLTVAGAPFEEYIIGPSNSADSSKWITNIYFPVK